MFSRPAALTILAVSAFAGACSQASPTAPTAITNQVVVGEASQETPSRPAAAVPVPANALGATRFLAFGDSITAGVESQYDGMFFFDSPAAAYPYNLEGMLAGHPPGGFVVTNSGVPGEAAFTARNRLIGELQAGRPQVLLLLEGINDMTGSGRTPSQAASSVAALVETGRLFNCTVLVATMFQTYESRRPDGTIKNNAHQSIQAFNNELLSRVAGQQNVHVIDLYAAFGTNWGAGYVGNDGLHPTSAGYLRMANEYHNRIAQIFPVRGHLQ